MDERPHDPGARQGIVSRIFFEYTVLVLTVLVAATTGAAFWYLDKLQDQLVSTLAEQGARLQSDTMEELRSLYTSDVVEKVRQHGIEVTHDYQSKDKAIPLPATLTIELGRRIGEHNAPGLQVRLYSDHPFPWRKDGGPRDAFERDALGALRRDPSQPFIRTEIVQGKPSIRYAVADRMRAQCIACHNSHPSSPKTDWKEGDVRGVLEVIRPISPFAAAAQQDLRGAIGLILVVAGLGLAGIGLVFGEQRSYAKGLADEIAERKRVEADLLASTARFSAMNEASPLGSFVTDAQRHCVYVNQMYQKITGYSTQDMARANWDIGIHPDDRERVLAQWQDAQSGFATECRFKRADGVITWVSCKVAAMRDDARLLGYVGTLEDISERKKVERMKNEFVSTVSHELRTPLTSIVGALGLLAGDAGGALPGQTKTLVEIASKNSERLVRLINDILDIEKIESGRMQFNLQPRELQPLVEQAIEANCAYAEQFDVYFVLVEALPGAQVLVDADSMMQVMTNLMANAAKFSPLGAVVDLRLTREGDMIRFAVTDRGPGIPGAFRDKVFEKFSQADSSDSRQKGGTGLGLSISKAIVEAMHGRIGFDSRQGAGSTFHVDLPEWIDSAPTAAALPAGLQRPKVLVSEDDRDTSSPL